MRYEEYLIGRLAHLYQRTTGLELPLFALIGQRTEYLRVIEAPLSSSSSPPDGDLLRALSSPTLP